MNTTQEKVLKELEETSNEYWNISRETANFLSILIKATNTKNILEIGTSNGYSGIWLAEALKTTNGHLTTIEFWDKRLSLAKQNFKECELDTLITTKLGSALEILPTLDEMFDMVFIDANKSEYIKYFKEIEPKLNKNAIIAADNVLSHAEKVKPFVEYISTHKDFQSQILSLPAGLLLAYKLC